MRSISTRKVIIRPVRPEELVEILRVEYKCFPDPYPLDLLQHLQRENPLSFLVAEVDGRVVGYIIGTVRFPNVGHVLAIGVEPEYRGKGIGTALMKSIFEYFKKRGVGKVRLEARESNKVARQFYRSLGFVEVTKVPYYYSDGETAVLYEKDLSVT